MTGTLLDLSPFTVIEDGVVTKGLFAMPFFKNVLYVDTTQVRDSFPDVPSAIAYINALPVPPGPSNGYLIKLMPGWILDTDIVMPDYTALESEGGMVVWGGDATAPTDYAISMGAGCALRNITLTPRSADKLGGVLIRDATTIGSAIKGPFNLNGLTLIVNHEDVPGSDVTVTFTDPDPYTTQQAVDFVNVALALTACKVRAVNAQDGYIYLMSAKTPMVVATDMTVIRSTGTANTVLGFSITADTLKARQESSTISLQNVLVVGSGAYTTINNGHGWTYSSVVSMEKSPFGIIAFGCILEGGHPTNPVAGWSILCGIPLFIGVGIDGINNNGYAVGLYDLGFYPAYPAFIWCVPFLCSYDIKTFGLTAPGCINMGSAAFDRFDPAGDATAWTEIVKVGLGNDQLLSISGGMFDLVDANFAPAETVSGANIDRIVNAFNRTTVDYVRCDFAVPSDLRINDRVVFNFYWRPRVHPNPGQDAVFQVESVATGDSGDWDTAFTVMGTVIGTNHITTNRITVTSIAIPIGTLGWAAGDDVVLRLSRLSTDVRDTLDDAATEADDDVLLYKVTVSMPRS